MQLIELDKKGESTNAANAFSGFALLVFGHLSARYVVVLWGLHGWPAGFV